MPPKARGRGNSWYANTGRKRANPRTRGDDDGGESTSTINVGPDQKKVRWNTKLAATATSSTPAASSTRGKRVRRAPSRASTGRPTTTGTEQGSTMDDGDNSDSEEEDQSEEEESSVDLDKTCLAAFCLHGRIAFAYYDPFKGVLHVLEDTQETGHFDLTRMLLEQVTPDYALTSSRSDDEFIDVMRDYMDGAGGTFQIRPYKEFNPKRGKERLYSLSRLSQLPCDQDDDMDVDQSESNVGGESTVSRNAYEFMRRQRATDATGDPVMQRWNALTRLANFANAEGSPFCMASVGALLDHLVRERAASDYDDEGIPGLDVKDIRMLALDQVMHINADALLSLQVFESESHASIHSDKMKEGLSLYGILNNTKTTLGRSLLRTWLLRPSLSLSTIRARHDALECFCRPENITTANSIPTHLKGIKNMPKIVKALESGRARLSDWQGFVKFAFHTTMIYDCLSELHGAHGVEIIKKVNEALDVATFKQCGISVDEIIDWEESNNADRICVRQHVDEELDNRKHTYSGIDSVLSIVAEQISETVPEHIASSLNVVYFPQLGYLICVPMRPEWENGQPIEAVDGWTFQFLSDLHVYFKSQEMHEMDKYVGDLHSLIVDRELEIVQELLEKVMEHFESVAEACDVAAELDVLLAMAQASRMNGYVRPEMVDENIIEIEQGRHPLHELLLDAFVSNDARLIGGAGMGANPETPDDSEDWNSVLLCTGANACGKSVYMKQIALIQIMAQVGCFVPAESAVLGVVDKIFTRVATRESVSKAQSAFMIDLNQVSLAIRNCTARSLIVLDEFGKGTLSTDGAGLFCGVLKHLLHRGPRCPKILVATHFHDVFTDELLDVDHWPITFCHMQVMFTSASSGANADGDDYDTTSQTRGSVPPGPGKEKITYLYRVAKGLSLQSHAAQCAAMFGIPMAIVERAQHVSDLISKHEVVQLMDEEMTGEEVADLAEAEAICKRFLEWDLEDRQGLDIKAKLRWVLGVRDGQAAKD